MLPALKGRHGALTSGAGPLTVGRPAQEGASGGAVCEASKPCWGEEMWRGEFSPHPSSLLTIFFLLVHGTRSFIEHTVTKPLLHAKQCAMNTKASRAENTLAL